MIEEVVLGMDMKAIFSDDWMLLRAGGGEVKIEIYPTGVSIFSMDEQVVINFSWDEWDRMVDFVNSRR